MHLGKEKYNVKNDQKFKECHFTQNILKIAIQFSTDFVKTHEIMSGSNREASIKKKRRKKLKCSARVIQTKPQRKYFKEMFKKKN